MNKIKSTKGVTLVSLVITIIVLLILATETHIDSSSPCVIRGSGYSYSSYYYTSSHDY